MPEREEETNRDRALVFLDQLTRNIVNRGNVISIKGMVKPESAF